MTTPPPGGNSTRNVRMLIERIEAAITRLEAYEKILFPVQCEEMIGDVRSLITALEQGLPTVTSPVGRNYVNIALERAEEARLALALVLPVCQRSNEQSLRKRQRAAQCLRKLATYAIDANIALLQGKPPQHRPRPAYLRLVPLDEEPQAERDDKGDAQDDEIKGGNNHEQ